MSSRNPGATSSDRRKVAILQTAFLGDTLLTIPLAKGLLESEVRSEDLALICRKGFGDLLSSTGLFGKIIEIEKGVGASYESAKQELGQWWKPSSQRILLSPHESPRSVLWSARIRLSSYFSAGAPVVTVGYRSRPFGVLSCFHTRTFDRQMRLPEALRQLALLQADEFSTSDLWRERLVGANLDSPLPGGRNSDGTLNLVPSWASMVVNRFSSLPKNPKQIVLAPGSVWSTKQWTEDGFVAVGRAATARGYEVAIVGTKEEAKLCEKIAFRVNEVAGEVASELAGEASTRGMSQSLAGKLSLVETTEVIAKSAIAFVNDSGAMHLASLANTKVVSFFGPTVLDFGYRPWNNNAVVLQTEEELKCRPCGLHGAKTCPIGTHICMKSIAPQRAIDFL